MNISIIHDRGLREIKTHIGPSTISFKLDLRIDGEGKFNLQPLPGVVVNIVSIYTCAIVSFLCEIVRAMYELSCISPKPVVVFFRYWSFVRIS